MKINNYPDEVFKIAGYDEIMPWYWIPFNNKSIERIKRITKYDFPRFHIRFNKRGNLDIHLDKNRAHGLMFGNIESQGKELEAEKVRLEMCECLYKIEQHKIKYHNLKEKYKKMTS